MNPAPPNTGPSLLTTTTNLLITGDDQKNLIIYSADTGKVLWHKEVGAANRTVESPICSTANSGYCSAPATVSMLIACLLSSSVSTPQPRTYTGNPTR